MSRTQGIEPGRSPLPTSYYLFFTVVEPFLTILGAVYSIFLPGDYFVSLYPPTLVTPPIKQVLHPASIMCTRQLGSCFFLFALFGSIALPRWTKLLGDQPKQLEEFVGTYLLCLAAADLTHIGFTLFDLGTVGTLSPFTHWNQLVVGNVVITLGLFVVRMMWFGGVGRSSFRLKEGKNA